MCQFYARSQSNPDARVWRRARIAVALAAVFGTAGCVTVIGPPAAPGDPVDVFVIDHGRTSSLVIPSGENAVTRYAYGDWNYYALGKNNLWRGIAALLWPTQSGLGRGLLQGPPIPDRLRAQIASVEQIHSVPVERSRLRAFEQSMEALYEAHRETEVSNPWNGLNFVHHPRPYTYLWNSNHAVASWLRELGCTTRGLSYAASWKVAPEQETN
jgi:hypothetical protein